MTGTAVQDYLKTIYKLSLEVGRVTPTAVAGKHGVSLAAVTKMVRRLEDGRLVRYSRKKGLELSPPGEKIALEMIRHHRLLELYLHQMLGYTWDKVDEEAEVLEHAISEEFEDRIDALLGHPTHDPHGSPIPTKDGQIVHDDYPPLSDLDAGSVAIIRRVDGSDSEMLRYLGDRGLFPGERVEVLGHEPYGGPISVKSKGTVHQIGPPLAERIHVEPQFEGDKN